MGFCPVSEMFHKVMERFCTPPKNKAKGNEVEGRRKIKGTVVLRKKNLRFLIGFMSCWAKVCLCSLLVLFIKTQLAKGSLGKVASVEKWVTTRTPLTAGETVFTITFGMG
ncbi:hypothetical protein NC652_024365 [Populus alba x Populus x berolinensis]|nr:hypothetical protein NC652_024365 [Populus alba x Populus x berolinensis]